MSKGAMPLISNIQRSQPSSLKPVNALQSPSVKTQNIYRLIHPESLVLRDYGSHCFFLIIYSLLPALSGRLCRSRSSPKVVVLHGVGILFLLLGEAAVSPRSAYPRAGR